MFSSNRHKVVFLILFGWAVLGLAKQYHFTNYTVEDGLAQSQVTALCQDSRGNIWMGTFGGGISIFDGHRFTNLTTDEGLRSNFITYLYEDYDDNIWFSMGKDGVGRYNGQQFFFMNEKDDSLFRDIFCIFQDRRGTMWFGSRNGVFQYDGKSLRRFTTDHGLPNNIITHLSETRRGNLLVATLAGPAVWEGSKFSPIETGLPEGNRAINRILEDGNGNIWLGSREGLVRISGDTIEHFTEANGLPNNFIRALLQDREGNIWVATNQGACRFDGKKFEPFTVMEGLCKDKLYTMMEDMQGNIWFGTNGGGVCKYSGALFVHFKEQEGLNNSVVWSIAKDPEAGFWVGTNEGLNYFDGERFSRPKFAEDLNNIATHIFFDSQNRMWVSVRELGLYLIQDQKIIKHYPRQEYFQRNYVHTMVELSPDVFWASTDSGLIKINHGNIEYLYTQAPYRIRRTTDLVLDADGTLWVGTIENGLMRVKDGMVTLYGESDGLAATKINTLLKGEDGILWIGTNGGISRFDGKSFCSITKFDGLKSNNIYLLEQDVKGNLWAGTERGLHKISFYKNGDPQVVQHFGTGEGFSGMECNENAVVRDPNGSILFGTVEGLTRYNPAADKSYSPVIPTHITDVRLFLEKTDWTKYVDSISPWTKTPVNLRLPYNQNHLTFEFVGVYHKSPNKVRYRYKLAPAYDSWSPLTDKTQAVYSNLAPGEYVFSVQAMKEGVGSQPAEQVFAFTITSPFWQTWWFFLIISGSLLTLLFAVSTLRTRNLRRNQEKLQTEVNLRTRELRLEKEKVEQANREITKQKEIVEQANRFKSEFLATMSHEIRTPMNGVIGMTELLARTSLSQEQQNFLRNIRLSGETLLALINDILDFSRIESGKLELENELFNPRDCVQDVLQMLSIPAYNKDLELVHRIAEDFPTQVRGDMGRLKQVLVNLLGNALKFTSKGEITVTAEKMMEDEVKGEWMLRFSVKDTGIGIPSEKLDILFESFTQVDSSTTRKYGGSGLGLAICSRLTKLMGGKIWVESEINQGSEFFFTIRVAKGENQVSITQPEDRQALRHKQVVVASQNKANAQMLGYYLALREVTPIYVDHPEAMILAAKHNPTHILMDDCLATDGTLPTPESLRPIFPQGVKFIVTARPGLAPILSEKFGTQITLLVKPVRPEQIYDALLDKVSPLAFQPKLVEHEEKVAEDIPMRILVVEDNLINQEVAVGMLSNLGYHPEVAVNGAIAVEMASQNEYDLIFMDVQMPVMDGLEATRRIRKHFEGQQQPIIYAMSANAIKGDREKAIEAGMDGYVSKPVIMREILDLLESLKEEKKGNPTESQPETNGHPAEEKESGAYVGDFIDLTLLHEISGGDPIFISSVLKKIRLRLPTAVPEMQVFLESAAYDDLRSFAHSIKSSSGYAGSMNLKERLQNIESIATAQDPEGKLPALLSEVESLALAVAKEIDEYLDSKLELTS